MNAFPAESKYKKAKEFAESLFIKFSPKLTYHNRFHAYDVLEATIRLSHSEEVDNGLTSLIQMAALYHDIGFIDTYENHEERGMDIVNKNFFSFGFSETEIHILSDMIKATKVPQSPFSLAEKILCDSDLDNFGREDFFETSEKVFAEKINFGFCIKKQEYYIQTLDFIKRHTYYTASAHRFRDEQKKKNIELLTQRIHSYFG